MSALPEGLKAYLRAPFAAIAWVMETYGANRARLKAFMSKPGVHRAFLLMISVTALAWIVINLIGDEEQGRRLNDAVKGLWPGEKNAPPPH